jgi:hypothetical protein
MKRSSPFDQHDSHGTTEQAEPDEDSVLLALERARSHSQRSLSEAALALRALLDAASLGVSGEPAHRNLLLMELARSLDQSSALLADAATTSSLQIVMDALDAQVERWEERSLDDPDARTVLRAFVGLREILFDSGFRTESNTRPSQTRRPVSKRSAAETAEPVLDPLRQFEFSK